MTDGEQLCFLLTAAVFYFLHLTPEVVLIKYARLGSVKGERGGYKDGLCGYHVIHVSLRRENQS